MDCIERMRNYLRDHGVPYEVQEHPTAFTAQEVAATEHIPGRTVAKVVMVLANRDLRMLVLPATQQVDLAKARDALGARALRLAEEREFAWAFPDCAEGAMAPFGNLYGIPVFADRRLGESERIVFAVGTHRTTMRIAYRDYERLVRPTVVDVAREPLFV